MGKPTQPAPPDPAKSYQQGIDSYLQNVPRLLASDEQYQPWLVDNGLAAVARADPSGTAVHDAYADRIQNDLASGYALPADYAAEIENNVRGSQAARGNILGTGAGSAEALVKGQAAYGLYQQRLDNARSFLLTPGPLDQIGKIPSIGGQAQQYGVNNYQNLLAQYQLAAGSAPKNLWARAADGASKGSIGGPYGALFGALDGAANGPLYKTTVSG